MYLLLAIIIIEIHIFRSTDSLIETGDWQFCMFYISRTTPLAFYLVGIFVWSDNTKQKVRLTKVTPFWRVWLVWSYLVVLPYMGIGFEMFISYGSRKQLESELLDKGSYSAIQCPPLHFQ